MRVWGGEGVGSGPRMWLGGGSPSLGSTSLYVRWRCAIAPLPSSAAQSAGENRSISTTTERCLGEGRIPRLRATIRAPRTTASLIRTELVVARDTASTFAAVASPGIERCENDPWPRGDDVSSL